MTEISSKDGDGQVVPLRLRPARSPALDPVERVEPTAKQNNAVSIKPKEEPRRSLSLVEDKDPLETAAALLEEIIPEFDQVSNTRLRIDKDDETGKFIYYNIDNESGEVIRRFPPESILKYLEQVRSPEGLVLDDEI